MGERERGERSMDLGVTTINGRFGESSAWERSRWKYWADVEGMVTRMFPRALSARNRSKRAEECSGPCPS